VIFWALIFLLSFLFFNPSSFLSSKGRQKTNSLTQWKALPSPSPFADNYANVNSFIGAGSKSNRLPSSMLGHNHKSQHGSNSARSGLGM